MEGLTSVSRLRPWCFAVQDATRKRRRLRRSCNEDGLGRPDLFDGRGPSIARRVAQIRRSLCCGCSNHYTLGGGRPESQNAEMRGAQSEESDREKRQPRSTEKIRIWATRRRCERPSSQPGPEPCEARPAVRFHHLFPAPKSCLQRPITCTTSLSGWVQAAGPVCVSLRAALSQCSRVIESFPFS